MASFQQAFLASQNPDTEGREAEALMELGIKEAKRQERWVKLANTLEMGSPEVAGKGLAEIAKFILTRIPEHQRHKGAQSLHRKLEAIDPQELSSKEMPAFSAIGQSITFIKNVLIGHPPDYIEKTLGSIIGNL